MGSEISESKQDNFTEACQNLHILVTMDWASQVPLEEETRQNFTKEFTSQTQVDTAQIIPVPFPLPQNQESVY